MLSMFSIAQWARARSQGSPSDGSESTDPAQMYVDKNQPFHTRLISACIKQTDNPKAAPEVLFLALPERLLGKCAYLCLGNIRNKNWKTPKNTPADISKSTVESLRRYDDLGRDAAFLNMSDDGALNKARDVLVCHGLSPIGDSILLLADMGRAYRVSRSLSKPPRAMLADVSWMSSNRSIRQFSSLSSRDIDTGLRVCLDKRRRLYETLGFTADLREITPFDRARKISGPKLQKIASHYCELAKVLWAASSDGLLSRDEVRLIDKPLSVLGARGQEALPHAISILGQFPQVLTALEKELKPHLEILRTIARRFHTFNPEVFTYFFAQYYAQDGYRGAVVKIAAESERQFDEPFDELDKYFKAWGDGHSASELFTGEYKHSQSTPLAGCYLPQYQIGGLKMLPYSPLSLDALHQAKKDHHEVAEMTILLSGESVGRERVCGVLRETPCQQRNRIVADLCSFLVMCADQLGSDIVENVLLTTGSVSSALCSISEDLPLYWAQECVAHGDEVTGKMWETWFQNLASDASPRYIPLHIAVLCMEESDWTDVAIAGAATIVAICHEVYRQIT